MDTPRQVKNTTAGKEMERWRENEMEERQKKGGAMDEGTESSAMEQTGIST